MYQNDDFEYTEVSYYKTETGESVTRYKTYQNNGWIRINEYYEDGTTTETFEYDR